MIGQVGKGRCFQPLSRVLFKVRHYIPEPCPCSRSFPLPVPVSAPGSGMYNLRGMYYVFW